MPGWIIALLTFPGIIIHEFAHKLACNITGVKVLKVRYLRFGNPPGYVLHEQPSGYGASLLISSAPFLLNSLLAIILFVAAIEYAGEGWNYLCYWLGIAVGIHAFPSKEDARNLWRFSKRYWYRPAVILGFPLTGLLSLGATLKIFWLDLLYSILLLLIAAWITGRISF